MARIKCVISYDGTHFSGLQIQSRQRTVQGELEKVLATIHKGTYIKVHPSGRTDKGVHAKGQTFHFDSDYNLLPDDWKRALNTMLPPDIHVNETKAVPASFHARFDVLEKEYRYYILNESEPDIFERNHVYHYPYTLDISNMQEAGRYFEGTHDFTTFSSAKGNVKGSKVRTLTEVSCHQEANRIEFVLRGNGFLYNMVRIIVGTLLEAGRHNMQPAAIPGLFDQEDRQLAGDTVPPQGLYLWQVLYEMEAGSW